MVIIGTPLKPVAFSYSKEPGNGYPILWINWPLQGMKKSREKSGDCSHKNRVIAESHRFALNRISSRNVAYRRMQRDGRMCVVQVQTASVPVQPQALLACGSTGILLCEAWGGLAR
jgi:hypothetical protein